MNAYLERQLTFVQFPAYSEVKLWKKENDNINDDDYEKDVMLKKMNVSNGIETNSKSEKKSYISISRRFFLQELKKEEKKKKIEK